MGISIFIDSSVTTVSPLDTFVPAEASIFMTFPAAPASIFTAPEDSAAAPADSLAALPAGTPDAADEDAAALTAGIELTSPDRFCEPISHKNPDIRRVPEPVSFVQTPDHSLPYPRFEWKYPIHMPQLRR